jgi:hypothetical protein
MRRWSVQRTVPTRVGFVVLVACAAIAGCSTVGTSTKTESIEGSQPAKVADTDIDCPSMVVRSGASTWQVPPGTPSTGLRYQASLGQMARECAILGESMTIKVGVEGRVLVGPKGAAGSMTVPVRMALVQEGPQPRSIWTKFYSVPIVIPQGQTGAAFTQVEDDLTFALPANKNTANYVIYVGFDPQGAANAAKGKRAAPTSRPVATTAKPKPKQQTATPPPAAGGFAPPASGGFAPPAQQ